MHFNFNGPSVLPWLLIGLSFLVLLTLLITAKAWRDAKRSPYFFMRRQAQQRMQSYSLAALILIVATFFTAAYARQTPVDTTLRVALIANTKPVAPELAASQDQVAGDESPEVVTLDAGDAASAAPLSAQEAISSTTAPGGAFPEFAAGPALLPDEYNRVEPEVERTDETELTSLIFTQEVTDDYEPLNPRRIFSAGFFTLYATFDYEGMADGMAWSWVWRYNGEVIGGGNELWGYGDSGPGFIFLNPEEGFQPGQYSLDVWVNGEEMTQANVIVTGGAVSSGN